MRPWRGAAMLSLVCLGCAASRGPSTPERYAQALEADQLDAAYALTTPAFRAQVSPAQFHARFADPAARNARALAVREGLGQLASAAPELFGSDATERPEEVILRFASAIRAKDFDTARACLSATLRKRYSVDALARDFSAEPTAAARVESAVLAAEGIAVRHGNTVRFSLASGGEVVLVHESGGWRLEALE